MDSPLPALDGRDLDVLVLGGGLTGAAVAREFALRGAGVALVEPVDFGWGASGRGTRLGLAALSVRALLGRRLRRDLLEQRIVLARSARHVVRVIPVVALEAPGGGLAGHLAARAGERLRRGWRGRGWPKARPVGTRARDVLLPPDAAALPAARDAAFDALVDDRRLAVLTALEARRHGAVLAARCDVTGLEAAEGGRAWIEVRDRLAGAAVTLRARAVINATGAWIDATRDLFDVGPRRALVPHEGRLRLVLDAPSEAAVTLRFPGGRTVLAAPAFGTTLLAVRPGKEPVAADDERALLHEAAALLFGGGAAVRAAFACDAPPGARPLLVREAARGIPFWSVTGGEPLLHRLAARHVADRLAAELGAFDARVRTATGFLPGGDIAGIAGEEAAARARGLEPDQARWLIRHYGALWREVVELPGSAEGLGPAGVPLLGEVLWAVRHEAARTLSDLLLRWRLPEIAATPAEAAAIVEGTARELAGILGWTPARTERERTRWAREEALAWDAATEGVGVATD